MPLLIVLVGTDDSQLADLASVWKTCQDSVGGLVSVRVFSQLPQSIWSSTVNGLRIPTAGGSDRNPAPAQQIQLALAWRVARQAFQMPDIDLLADPIPTASGSGNVQVATASSPAKKVKFSSVIDQLGETEINTMTQKELDQAYANHTEITGAEPPSEAEPIPDQIAALKQRVVDRRECPCADFSVLTPFGRRLQKQMKARSWVLQVDGTFKGLDVPGPPSYDAWAARWKVYRSALFMLRYPSEIAGQRQVVTAAALEEYSDRIAKLNAEFPETWHLVMQAEDRCWGEMFERYRRLLTKAAAVGRLPMAIDFDVATPWTGVFIYAARDIDFWNEHVVRPAQNFIARGRRCMSQQRAEEVNLPRGPRRP